MQWIIYLWNMGFMISGVFFHQDLQLEWLGSVAIWPRPSLSVAEVIAILNDKSLTWQ